MLTDIDKSSADRSSPSPNTHDVLTVGALSAKGTNSVNYVTPASNTSVLIGAKNGQFTIAAVVYVPIPQSFSAPTTAGAGVFGTSTVTVATQSHGLPYTPGILAYFDYPDFNEYDAMPLMSYAGFAPTFARAVWNQYRVGVDATNIYLYYDTMIFGTSTSGNNTFTVPASIKCYLLQQTSS